MRGSKLGLLLLIALLIGTFFALGLGQYLTLDALQARQAALAAWVDTHFWQASALFFIVYVLSTALCSITGVRRVLSSATYSAPRRPGNAKSSCKVPHCQMRPSESFSENSIFGP